MKSSFAVLLIVSIIYMLSTELYGFFKIPIALAGTQIEILVMPLNALHDQFVPQYLLLFLPYFLAMGVLFFGFMRPKGGNISLFKECIINSLILAVAPLIMLLFYYVPTYADMGTNTLFNYLGSPGGGAGARYDILYTGTNIQRDNGMRSNLL